MKDDYAAGKIGFDDAVREYTAIYPRLTKEAAEKVVRGQFKSPKDREAAGGKRPKQKLAVSSGKAERREAEREKTIKSVMHGHFAELQKFVEDETSRVDFLSYLMKRGYTVSEAYDTVNWAQAMLKRPN